MAGVCSQALVTGRWGNPGQQGELRVCLWGQGRGQKVTLVPQRIRMDKQKALALLCAVVSQEPPAFENLCSLFQGLRDVRAKEYGGSEVKGKVRQLSKAWLLEKPPPHSEVGKGNCCYAATTQNIKAAYLDAPRTRWQLGGPLMHAWYANHTLSPGPPLPLTQPRVLFASSARTHRVYFWVACFVSVCDNVYFITWLWGTALRLRPCSHHTPPRACPSVAHSAPETVCGARGHVAELNDIREETDNARDLDLRVFRSLMNI